MRMVKGLANAHAATIVAVRAERQFLSVDDLWRRAGAPACRLRHSFSLPRPTLSDLHWVLSGARRFGRLARRFADEPTPSLRQRPQLREDDPAAEIEEPIIALRPMTAGSEVVMRIVTAMWA